MKRIRVTRNLVEALSLASKKPFKKEIINGKFKIYGEVLPHKTIPVEYLNSSYLCDFIQASFGDNADKIAISKEIEAVTRNIAFEALNNRPTYIEWVV